jgi:hypothetical protein
MFQLARDSKRWQRDSLRWGNRSWTVLLAGFVSALGTQDSGVSSQSVPQAVALVQNRDPSPKQWRELRVKLWWCFKIRHPDDWLNFNVVFRNIGASSKTWSQANTTSQRLKNYPTKKHQPHPRFCGYSIVNVGFWNVMWWLAIECDAVWTSEVSTKCHVWTF